jgi:tRNA 2-thiouridine synthesizing protein A
VQLRGVVPHVATAAVAADAAGWVADHLGVEPAEAALEERLEARARKAMKGLEAGQILRVLATDPSALQDFPAFCETTGHELLQSGEAGEGLYLFLLRKKG